MNNLISVSHDGPAHTGGVILPGAEPDLPADELRQELRYTYEESSVGFTPMLSSTDPVEFTAAVLSQHKDALRPGSFPAVGVYLRHEGRAYRISGVGTDDSGSIYVTVDDTPIHPGEEELG